MLHGVDSATFTLVILPPDFLWPITLYPYQPYSMCTIIHLWTFALALLFPDITTWVSSGGLLGFYSNIQYSERTFLVIDSSRYLQQASFYCLSLYYCTEIIGISTCWITVFFLSSVKCKLHQGRDFVFLSFLCIFERQKKMQCLTPRSTQ